ncbi:uncharacterized protein LOC127846175 [Dreissena polymorpha]|uniref:uncharacterized protein LOC127846175 n=1 Tax=Dreissena polymorpha TaxID=45954 RepID=UPI0022648B16|nr:uncharacterized protein LOC127846175 [Dreissena polymorpha]
MHQPKPCPNSICDDIRDEIIKKHRYKRPSWKNTSAEQWTSNHWELAKCFMPPDGYAGVSNIQGTDFNGVISVMMNCSHFDGTMSFIIASQQPSGPCLLTKAREISNSIRHSPTCKVQATDLNEIFKTMLAILEDSRVLAHDTDAQDAASKLKQLQNESTDISLTDVYQLLKESQEASEQACQVSAEAKVEIKTLMDKIRELENKFDNSQTCVKNVNPEMEDTIYAQKVLELRRRLIKHYTDNTQYVSVMQNHDISLMEIYATPAIHRVDTKKDGKRKKSEPVFTYKGMFYIEHESKQRIFIQGEPGKGKSTFASKLVLDWCNECISARGPTEKDTDFSDTETLKVFKFVFYIALRDSRNQRKVTDMIKKQIIEKIYFDKDVDSAHILLQTILEKEKCLVVQDGLDEWSDPEKEAGLPLLAASLQSIVLITTRPWKMSDDRLKNSQVDCLLEIEGVKDSFVLCRKVLDCLISDDLDRKVVQFTRYIHDNGLAGLLATPMLITPIVCLWVDNTYLTGSSCQIYTIIIDGMLKKANTQTEYFQDPPFQCFNNTKHIKPNLKQIESLSKAAFYLLLNIERENALVFSEADILKHISIEEKMFAITSGILSERTVSTLSYRPSTCSFFHTNVQEFLAAIHIASNEKLIYDVIVPYFDCHQNAWFEISHVFKFLCGLNINAANILSRAIDECQQQLYDRQHSICMKTVCQIQDFVTSGFVEH